MVRERGRLQADLPFRGDPELNLPARVYRPYWRELDPFVRVERVEWEDGKLVIKGCAFVPSVDITQAPAHLQARLTGPCARSRRGCRSWCPPARPSTRTATGWSRQDRYSYDWAGFRVRDQPALVPGRRPVADRGLGRLRAGPGPRRLAPGPAAHAGGRPGRAAGAAPGGAGRPVRRPLGRPPAARAVTATPALLAAAERPAASWRWRWTSSSPAGWRADLACLVRGASSAGAARRAAERLARGAVRPSAPVPDAVLLRGGGRGGAGGRPAPAGAAEWDLVRLPAAGRAAGPGRVRGRAARVQVPDRKREIVVARTRYGNAAIVRRRAAGDRRG